MSNVAQKRVPTFSAVYTIAEAARLCGLPAAQVHRWIRSFSSVAHTSDRVAERGTVGLDFLDLVEIRYVKGFVEAGVSLQALRAAHEQVAQILRVDHPFATKRFFTD